MNLVPAHLSYLIAKPLVWFIGEWEEKNRSASLVQGHLKESMPELRCAVCRHVITDEKYLYEISGSFRHTFTNPHGAIFHIGCFRDAPGCKEEGIPTLEFSWFPAFHWQVTHCGDCGIHMGWRYTSSHAGGFYGLILDRLIRSSQ